MKPRDADKSAPEIPQLSVAKFLQNVEERAWTEAEKELDTIRQKSQNSAWARGYVKALEGLLLTHRSNDDKYLYLPKILANRSEETITHVRDEFAEFSSNELHGDYDRGYFKALENYLGLVKPPKGASEKAPASPPSTVTGETVKEQEEAKYSEGSS